MAPYIKKTLLGAGLHKSLGGGGGGGSSDVV